jgi:hypothetical protein
MEAGQPSSSSQLITQTSSSSLARTDKQSALHSSLEGSSSPRTIQLMWRRHLPPILASQARRRPIHRRHLHLPTSLSCNFERSTN